MITMCRLHLSEENMKKQHILWIATGLLLTGCGENHESEKPEAKDAVPLPAPVVQSNVTAPVMPSEPDVIVYGEEIVEAPPVLTPLERLLESVENCDSVGDLRKALAGSADPIADLARLCREAGGNTALLAVQALVQIGSPEATLELISLVSDLPAGRFKTDVLFEAEQLNASDSVAVLLEGLKVAEDHDVQRFCQQSLANVAESNLIARIQYDYSEMDSMDGRNALAETLRYIDDENAVPALIALVESSETLTDPLALAAVDALGTIGSDGASQALFQWLETRDSRADQEVLLKSTKRLPELTNG